MQKGEKSLPAVFSTASTYSFKKPQKPTNHYLELYDFSLMHFHSFVELGLCLEGTGVCCVNGVEHNFKAGDVEIILPFQRHLSRSFEKSRSRWMWLNINPYDLIEDTGLDVTVLIKIMRQEIALSGIFTPEQYPQITAQVTRLFNEVSVDAPQFTRMCTLRFYEIILTLARESAEKGQKISTNDQGFDVILPAINAIEEGLKTGSIPTIKQLSALCGVCVTTFRSFFQQTVGINPKDYIIRMQVYTARKLLITTDKSILEVGILSGFKEVSGLNRHFREQMGMSPSDYKKKHKIHGRL